MKYEDVVQIWGRELLRDAGFEMSNDERVDVEIIQEEHGYCSTCAYTAVRINVYASRNSTKHVRFDDYDFMEALNGLVKTSIESQYVVDQDQ